MGAPHSTMAWASRHRWLVGTVGALVVAVAATLVVVLWPEPEEQKQRARPYRDYDVCVLTPAAGLADPQAAAVWAGAQEVSLARSVRLRYRQVSGEQTAARAGEYLASLVQQGCEVIVAVGVGPAAAAGAQKASYPDVTIVAVGAEIDGSSTTATIRSTTDILMNLVPEG